MANFYEDEDYSVKKALNLFPNEAFARKSENSAQVKDAKIN